MIKIEKTAVMGWEAAIRGMRNPMNSWDKIDTIFDGDKWCLGKADHDLMLRLRNAGTDHRKFMRMIGIYADITAPQFWWFEYDTYKVSTVRNSCSKMHRIHIKPFEASDFSCEGIEEVGELATLAFNVVIRACESLRLRFNETQDKKYWRALIELLPEGYNMKATVYLNYETAANMYRARKNHKVQEWRDFCRWIESLPYSELITGDEKQ